ncbi:MAG: hypothetical protein IE933_03260 [Sphingomonadales bacterium]|nr:hypothetical protein [Sphingomonadales bacterium]MBD3772060.1 hypothetical protein [Paracoccaceae bacterium]
MKIYAVTALAAALALGACSNKTETTTEAPTPTATETVAVPTGDSTTIVAPTATVAPDATPSGSSVTIDGKDVDATISTDGVQAKVKTN